MGGFPLQGLLSMGGGGGGMPGGLGLLSPAAMMMQGGGDPMDRLKYLSPLMLMMQGGGGLGGAKSPMTGMNPLMGLLGR
jgi:hypothetical protein